MAELVTIPIAIFDLIGQYKTVNIRLAGDRIEIVDALFKAFAPWNIGIDDLEILKDGKPSDQGIKFKIVSKRTSFYFGPSFFRFTWDDANWENAEETIKILRAGVQTLLDVGKLEISHFDTSVSLHLQPRSLPFAAVLTPFAPPQMGRFDASPIKGLACIVRWEDTRVTVDGSNQLANGVFLKFERRYSGTTAFEVIADSVLQDEQRLFKLLDVEEDHQ